MSSLRHRPWTDPVSSPRLVVIAASAGGLEPIVEVLTTLGHDFPVPIVVLKHRGTDHPDLLPRVLAERTQLEVRHAESGDLLRPGVVYVCPAGAHLTAEHCLRVIEGPRVDFVRPSADVMLRSVARVYGPRAIAVVLSGSGSDGAAGSVAVSEAGGTVIVQSPESSEFDPMPTAALRSGRADLVLAPREIARALRSLVEDRAQTEKGEAIRVLLADDHLIILDGLKTLLARERDMEVVGEAQDGRMAVRLARTLEPDVVVMDVAMPRLSGIDAIRRLKFCAPSTNIIALSANTDRSTIVQAARAGARGYLSKTAAFGELARAIRAVAAHQPYFASPFDTFVAEA